MASQLVGYSYRDTSQLEHAYQRALSVNTLSDKALVGML